MKAQIITSTACTACTVVVCMMYIALPRPECHVGCVMRVVAGDVSLLCCWGGAAGAWARGQDLGSGGWIGPWGNVPSSPTQLQVSVVCGSSRPQRGVSVCVGHYQFTIAIAIGGGPFVCSPPWRFARSIAASIIIIAWGWAEVVAATGPAPLCSNYYDIHTLLCAS